MGGEAQRDSKTADHQDEYGDDTFDGFLAPGVLVGGVSLPFDQSLLAPNSEESSPEVIAAEAGEKIGAASQTTEQKEAEDPIYQSYLDFMALHFPGDKCLDTRNKPFFNSGVRPLWETIMKFELFPGSKVYVPNLGKTFIVMSVNPNCVLNMESVNSFSFRNGKMTTILNRRIDLFEIGDIRDVDYVEMGGVKDKVRELRFK